MSQTATEVDVMRSTEVQSPIRRRDEIAIAFFGTWMILGLFLDGWAHQVDKPETFFSPWHGVLYSGFAAAQLFYVREGWRERRSLSPVSGGLERLLMVGLAMFVAGALGDFVWHEIFGIEVDLEALLSPTHLLLFSGGLLMVTAPVRAAWQRGAERAPSVRAFFPTLVCITLATALVAFFVWYLTAWNDIQVLGRTQNESLEVIGIVSVLVSNALLLGAALLVLRRWVPPFGSFTFLFGVVATMMAGLSGFSRAPLIVPAIAGGLVADLFVRRSRGTVPNVRTLAMVVPLIFWTAYFVLYDVTLGLRWPAELWTGSIILAVMGGLGLSLLTSPPRTPAEV